MIIKAYKIKFLIYIKFYNFIIKVEYLGFKQEMKLVFKI